MAYAEGGMDFPIPLSLSALSFLKSYGSMPQLSFGHLSKYEAAEAIKTLNTRE